MRYFSMLALFYNLKGYKLRGKFLCFDMTLFSLIKSRVAYSVFIPHYIIITSTANIRDVDNRDRQLHQYTCYLVKIDWLINWLGFNAVFNNFSVILRRPVHLLMHLLVFSHQYTTQQSSQATGCFLTLLEDEWRMPHWLLSIIGKKVGRAGIRTHNPWIDSYRGSARPFYLRSLFVYKI